MLPGKAFKFYAALALPARTLAHRARAAAAIFLRAAIERTRRLLDVCCDLVGLADLRFAHLAFWASEILRRAAADKVFRGGCDEPGDATRLPAPFKLVNAPIA